MWYGIIFIKMSFIMYIIKMKWKKMYLKYIVLSYVSLGSVRVNFIIIIFILIEVVNIFKRYRNNKKVREGWWKEEIKK